MFFPLFSLHFITKNVFPLEKRICFIFESLPLFLLKPFFGLPLFQFLFLCLFLCLSLSLSLSLSVLFFFLPSCLFLLSFGSFFLSLSFLLFFCFCFMKGTTSKQLVAISFFINLYSCFGVPVLFSFFQIPFSYLFFVQHECFWFSKQTT